jgi:hypothetical protein
MSATLFAEAPCRQSLNHRIKVIKPQAGRPLSPRMAWAMLWVASGLRPAGISPPELVRANRYARRPAAEWPRLLTRRAAVYRGRVLPAQVHKLLTMEGVYRGGISAAADLDLDLIAPDEQAELYMTASVLDTLQKSGKLRLGSNNANVVLRVPSIPSALPTDSSGAMPSAVVAADLLDAGDERSVRTAHELLGRRLGTG